MAKLEAVLLVVPVVNLLIFLYEDISSEVVLFPGAEVEALFHEMI